MYLCSLRAVLADHMNAEIVAGTITSKQDAMDYVTWTYFFRRLLMNPSYYQLEEATKDSVNSFLSRLVSGALAELESSYCIEFEEVNITVESCDYAPLLCMLASGKTWEGAYSRDRDIAA